MAETANLSPKKSVAFSGGRPETPPSAPSATPATTSTTAVTTSTISPRNCEFEEVAYLLVHGRLPDAGRALRLQSKAQSACAASPPPSREHSKSFPAHRPPHGVCAPASRCSAACAGARQTTTKLAPVPSPTVCWPRWAPCSSTGTTTPATAARIEVETDEDRIAAHFLHLLHGEPPSAEWVAAMQASLILYAEHEFNASTFTARVIAGTGSDIYSAVTGAIGALRGPKHGGANEVALEIQNRYASPDEAEHRHPPPRRQTEVIIGFGHPGLYNQPIRATKSSRTSRASSPKRPAAMKHVRNRRADRRSDVRKPSGCSPTSTGSAPLPIT